MSTDRRFDHSFESIRDRVLTRGSRMEIEAHITGMRELDRVHSWTRFEERNQARSWVLALLGQQAGTIRRTEVRR